MFILRFCKKVCQKGKFYSLKRKTAGVATDEACGEAIRAQRGKRRDTTGEEKRNPWSLICYINQ
jgi:hypothetical protein